MRFIKRLFIVALAVFVIGFGAAGAKRVYHRFTRVQPAPLPPRKEVTLTIIPGWNLRQVADYLVLEGFASTTADVYAITGKPAVRNEKSKEGFLAPETVRVFAGASLASVIEKFTDLRDKQITDEMRAAMTLQGRSLDEILTMASIVEDEARTLEDRKIVADILWRRVKIGWALQVDSSVHYAIDKMGTVYTTDDERTNPSPWNTYRYPGLPPGPICNPSVQSIEAALYPTPNKYWYFLSGKDGTMHYAKTLEEHAANKKYL